MPAAEKPECAHSAAPPLQIEPALLGFDLVLGTTTLADVISFAATIFLAEQSSPLTHYVAAPFKPEAQGFEFVFLV